MVMPNEPKTVDIKSKDIKKNKNVTLVKNCMKICTMFF